MLEKLLHSDNSALWKSLVAIIPDYAKSSGLVQRVSASFNPAGFLLTLLTAATTGKASFNQLARGLRDKIGGSIAITPQAFHGRMNRTETGVEEFMILCLSHICRWKWSSSSGALPCVFTRIIVEDASFLPFHKSNAENHPAHGNASGKTAGCKIDLAFDLLSGEILLNELHTGTQQDKASGWDLLEHILPKDLILRDMGYFSVRFFKAVENRDAFWLSRLPLNVGVTDEDGKPIERVLRKHRGDRLDIRVELTAGKHSARLVAIRAGPEETAKRRRQHKAEAKAKGRTANSRTLLLAGWHIMVTNIPAEMQTADDLAVIYSQRWQIEIIFRGWKQATELGAALKRKSSSQHLKAIVLAGMIVLAIGVKIAIRLVQIQPGRYSLEKIYGYLAEQLAKITDLLELSRLQPEPRHLQTQKRTRKSLAVKLFEFLG